MGKKKLEAIRNLSVKELSQKISETQKALFESKIKLSTGQLENTATLWILKKQLARFKTFMTQKQSA